MVKNRVDRGPQAFSFCLVHCPSNVDVLVRGRRLRHHRRVVAGRSVGRMGGQELLFEPSYLLLLKVYRLLLPEQSNLKLLKLVLLQGLNTLAHHYKQHHNKENCPDKPYSRPHEQKGGLPEQMLGRKAEFGRLWTNSSASQWTNCD